MVLNDLDPQPRLRIFGIEVKKCNQFLVLFPGNADWYVLDENLNRRVRLEEEMLEEISAAMEANEDQYVEIEEGKHLQGGLVSQGRLSLDKLTR